MRTLRHRLLGVSRAWLALGLLLFSSRSSADVGFWQRVRQASSPRELRTLVAVERVLSGRGEEMDLLLVRTALVELMREEIKTPRTVILLFHLRRQLGFSPPSGGAERLAEVIGPSLSSFDRALGYYELARLLLDEALSGAQPSPPRRLDQARTLLEKALVAAWEPDLRSEVLFYRGMLALRVGRFSSAHQDFRQVLQLADSDRRLKNTYLAVALAHMAEGHEERAAFAARLARDWERRDAQVTDDDLLADIPLSEIERTIAGYLLHGVDSSRTPANGEHWALDAEQCAILGAVAPSRITEPFAVVAARLQRHCSDESGPL